MADEVAAMPEVEEAKMPRLLLRNPDSGEPWACIADLPLNEMGKRAVSDFVIADIENLVAVGDTRFSIEAKVQMMTETEVESLPEM